MPLNCASIGPQIPTISTRNQPDSSPPPPPLSHLQDSAEHTQKAAACSATLSSCTSSTQPLMEDCHENLELSPPVVDKYSKELEIAVRVVQLACSLCQRLQESLVSKANSQDNNSPVTVAVYTVQATVSWVLSRYFGSGSVSIVAEEESQALSKLTTIAILKSVTKTVNECLFEAPQFGLADSNEPLGTEQVLEALGRCNSRGGPTGRFWALDAINGRLGFVRGDQYAVAISLIEEGQVVLGVLGWPNYPMRKEWLSYHHQYHRLISKLTPQTSETWDKGCVFYARRGTHKAWMQPLLQRNRKLEFPGYVRPVRVSSIDNPAFATFCEPFEKTNSSHSFTAGLAHSVGLRKQPLRVCVMVRYAAIARGDAEIFMKFARAGYKEKIWDHAAGVVIIEEAGGVVTDLHGRSLDFSKGIYLDGLDRGIVACSGAKLHEKIINGVDSSWGSSCL